MDFKIEEAINTRYSELAGSTCCLSCGTALAFGDPLPGEICVDLGSGRGNDVLRLSEEVGKKGFVYGIDISDGMLEKASKRAANLGIENVKFIKSELESLPLPDGTADLLISNCTINHAEDKQSAWNEIFRILKPGGRFVVSDIYSIEQVPEEYASDPQAVAECWAGAATKDAYLNTVVGAGFSDLRILEESLPYQKEKIEVASFTLYGVKPGGKRR